MKWTTTPSSLPLEGTALKVNNSIALELQIESFVIMKNNFGANIDFPFSFVQTTKSIILSVE